MEEGVERATQASSPTQAISTQVWVDSVGIGSQASVDSIGTGTQTSSGNAVVAIAPPPSIGVETQTLESPRAPRGTQTLPATTAQAATGTIESPRTPRGTQTLSTTHVAAATQAKPEALEVEAQATPDVVGA